MNTPDSHTSVLYTPRGEWAELASCAVCDDWIKEQTDYGGGRKKTVWEYRHVTFRLTLFFKSVYWNDRSVCTYKMFSAFKH
jgi:hypothetical protein